MNQRVLWIVIAACAGLVATLSWIDGSTVTAVVMTAVFVVAVWQAGVARKVRR